MGGELGVAAGRWKIQINRKQEEMRGKIRKVNKMFTNEKSHEFSIKFNFHFSSLFMRKEISIFYI